MSNLKLTSHDSQLGITTTLHVTESKVAIQKTYDAAPFKEYAAEERALTDGQRWGEMRKVGVIPMAELATMMRQDGGFDRKRVIAWLRRNPDLVTFSKALK